MSTMFVIEPELATKDFIHLQITTSEFIQIFL